MLLKWQGRASDSTYFSVSVADDLIKAAYNMRLGGVSSVAKVSERAIP